MMPYRHSKLAKIALIVFFILIAVYAYFEARNILFGPTISLDGEQIKTVHERRVFIAGVAENIAHISMNGRRIAVTEDGTFEEPLVLIEGRNTVLLTAVDKFGRTTEKTLEIIYKPNEDQ